MSTRRKSGIGAIVCLGLIGLTILGAKKSQASNALQISIFDESGNPVPHNSPFALNEGQNYTVKVTVKNNTTKGGAPWPAALTVTLSAGSIKKTYISQTDLSYSYSGGETHEFTKVLTTAIGDGPDTGTVQATLRDPAGNVLANASEQFTVDALAVIYGGTIVFS